MTDASELGIFPPSTVRIDMGGWIQDWPFECVELEGDMVLIVGHVGLVNVHHALNDPHDIGRWGLCYYPYEHARELSPGCWQFHGREDFTVTAGPPQPVAVN